MNRTAIVGAIVAALGFWAGVSAWQSAWVMTTFLAALAMVMAANILFCLWVWYRAAPDSGDAMVMPELTLHSASILVGLVLPKLFWPDAAWLHAVVALAFATVTIPLFIRQIRRRRALRQSTGLS